MAFPDGWGYRWPIAINADSVITSPVSAWPCLVTDAHFPEAAWNYMQATGADLRFSADEAGTSELYYDAPRLSVVGKSCHLYVQVPTLLSTGDTTIYGWVGNPTATAPSAAWMQNTYPADWAAFWPMEEGAGNAIDVIGGLTATLVGGAAWATGPYGNKVVQLTESASDYLALPTGILTGPAETILMRIYYDTAGGANNSFFNYSTGYSSYKGRHFSQWLGNSRAIIKDDDGHGATLSQPVAVNQWATYGYTKAADGTLQHIVNANITQTASALTGTMAAATDHRLGGLPGGSYMRGYWDNYLLCDSAMSTDELRVWHLQYSTPATWASAGALVAVGGGAVLPMFGGYNLGKSLLRGANL